MGRKKAETKAHEEPARTVGDLDDDQLYALTCQHKKKYEEALAAKKKAAADFLNVTKLARAECGPGVIDDIKDMIALESEGGEEKLKATVERQLRAMRWVGLAVGTQAGLFDEPDRTPAVDKAFAEGKRVGLAGAPCKPDHAPETPQYQSYMKGFHEGQAVLAKGFKSPDAPTGSVPRDEWKAGLQEQNDKIGAEIKKASSKGASAAVDSLATH